MTVKKRTLTISEARDAMSNIRSIVDAKKFTYAQAKRALADIGRIQRSPWFRERLEISVSEMASMGGKATAKKLTPEERSASARRAARARWAKRKEGK